MRNRLFLVIIILLSSCKSYHNDNLWYESNNLWMIKVNEADSLSKCGYLDVNFEDCNEECTIFMDSVIKYLSNTLDRNPLSGDLNNYIWSDLPIESEYSLIVYKYGLGGEQYDNYLKAFKERYYSTHISISDMHEIGYWDSMGWYHYYIDTVQIEN